MADNQNDQNPPDNAGGGFGLGVVIGALAGAGAFYLFGTKKGGEVKEKLIDEYYKAKEELEHNPEFQAAAQKMEETATAITQKLHGKEAEQALAEAKSLLEKLTHKVHKLTAQAKVSKAKKPAPHKTTSSTDSSSKRYFKKK